MFHFYLVFLVIYVCVISHYRLAALGRALNHKSMTIFDILKRLKTKLTRNFRSMPD